MKRTVLIFRTELLPPSETFIASHATALRRYSPVFAGLRYVRAGYDLVSSRVITLTQGNSLAEKCRRRGFLHRGPSPDLLETLSECRPALLHAHFAVDAAAALPIAEALQLPLVVTLHGYDVTSTDQALRRTAGGRAYVRRRERLFSRAARFLCVSEHIRHHAVRRGFPQNKLRVLPLGVDLELFAPDPLRSRSLDPIVLFVGRLVEKKGCGYLLRAMAAIQGRHPTAKLLIVGDGPQLSALRAEASKTVRQCTFLGPQPPGVVRDLMHRARLLAAPSILAASGDSEGLPIVLCEAQAMGLPIAAFRGPGVSEAVAADETALLVPQGDEHALGKAISAILDDDGLAKRIGAAGRLRAEAFFDLKRQTALLEDLYDGLLA